MAEVPKSDDEGEEDDDGSDGESGNEAEGYAKLCSVFDTNSGRTAALDSDDDLSSDASDDDVDTDGNDVGDGDEAAEVADEGDIGENEEEEGESEDDSEEGSESEDAVEDSEVSGEDEEGSDSVGADSEGDVEDEKSAAGDPSDPFVARYESGEIPTELMEATEAKRYSSPEVLSWKHLGRLTFQRVGWTARKERREGTEVKRRKITLDDSDDEDGRVDKREKKAAEHRNDLVSGIAKPFAASESMESGYVKEQLSRNVVAANSASLNVGSKNPVTAFQAQLLSVASSYRDLLFTERTFGNGEQIRMVYALHALNHVLKTRTRIVKNNVRLMKAREAKTEHVGECRDQGLTRPKVLIVVPFRDSAKRVVRLMSELLFGKENLKRGGGGVANMARFESEYDAADQERRNKPDDFYDTFSGNVDDAFNLGIAVTKKALKLYADFYSSDIIISSPLGLRMAMGSSDDDAGGKQNSDFLSSIEVLIMDQVDVFAMQNWDHVTGLFDGLNKQPKDSHGVDFTRVRMWALNKQSIFYRQTLMFSHTPMPEANALFNRCCHNYMGKVRSSNPVPDGGNISKIMVSVPIVFHRFESQSVRDSPDDRFDYFTSRVMPEYKKDVMFHTCVFVPSYFDYVRVRNWFGKADLDFLEVCEYTKDNKIAKARDHFFHGETHFLLYTERAHFFRRFAIKGIRHLIFFQPPQHPHFFSELCNYLQPAYQNRKGGGSDGNMTITVLYNKYDAQRLASALGSEKAGQIVRAEKKVHVFVAGS